MVYGLLHSAITGKVCAVALSWCAGLHRWLQVAAIETAVSETDIFASSTCHYNVIILVYVKMLIVGNTGHLDNEID